MHSFLTFSYKKSPAAVRGFSPLTVPSSELSGLFQPTSVNHWQVEPDVGKWVLAATDPKRNLDKSRGPNWRTSSKSLFADRNAAVVGDYTEIFAV